jgi:hypothetical protein
MPNEQNEIVRIEHELDILRRRRATYRAWFGPKLTAALAAMAVLILLTFAALVWQQTQDPLYGAFVIVVAAALAALCWLFGTVFAGVNSLWPLFRIRRVNIVRSMRRPAGLVPLYKTYAHPPSEAVEIDEMIGWRERRLAELKGMRQ